MDEYRYSSRLQSRAQLQNNMPRNTRSSSAAQLSSDSESDSGPLLQHSSRDPKNQRRDPRNQRKSDEGSRLPERGVQFLSSDISSNREKSSSYQYSIYIKVIPVIVTVLISVCYCFYVVDNAVYVRDEEVYEMIANISKAFPTQDKEMWDGFVSILLIVGGKQTCPKSILLLDRGDDQAQRTSHCLASEVASSSASLLTRRARKHLTWTGTELDCKNCIEELRGKVEEHRTVFIDHLEKFSLKSASALHFFCDEHDENFAKAVYILTMSVKNDEGKAAKAAEEEIRSLWPHMKTIDQEALIARLTSLAFFVKPENVKC